jgi:hypothetical protein
LRGEVMKNAVEISVVCPDHLRVWASNGVFVGQTEVFANSSTLSTVVSALRGFPANASDRRACELGTFDEAFGGGGAAFRFSCMDSIGHALVEVRLRTDPQLGVGASDLATIHIPIEAAAMDAFVGQLERMLPEPGESAVLEAAS